MGGGGGREGGGGGGGGQAAQATISYPHHFLSKQDVVENFGIIPMTCSIGDSFKSDKISF